MNKIGIIGAMEVEVEILKTKIENLEIKTFAKIDFYTGKIKGKNIVLAKSGIGKVNAAICTQILIDKFDVDSVVNTGVAGAIGDVVGIYDIVVSTELLQHDFDTTAIDPNDKLGVVCGLDVETFKADENLKNIVVTGVKEILNNNIYEGIIATGDQFISSMDKKEFIKKNFNAMCAEMEGGAIAHTCYLNDIPFVVVRCISDKADGSAEVDYPTFVKQAATSSSKIVEYLIENC